MNTTQERPELAPLKVGKEFKTFTVTGKKGMEMPTHISTKEAVVIVQEGSALLKIDGKEQTLEKEGVYIIPEKVAHSLLLLSDFKAVALMAVDSEIEFV
ncbi:MAG TPA: cupin domain-containing protein [Salinimicrobium sp.]|nr:cupin domain-containing protein [Salinimicrobium sp.]